MPLQQHRQSQRRGYRRETTRPWEKRTTTATMTTATTTTNNNNNNNNTTNNTNNNTTTNNNTNNNNNNIFRIPVPTTLIMCHCLLFPLYASSFLCNNALMSVCMLWEPFLFFFRRHPCCIPLKYRGCRHASGAYCVGSPRADRLQHAPPCCGQFIRPLEWQVRSLNGSIIQSFNPTMHTRRRL
uniref:Uncharacterized protein n=1 Tax=Eutreptiella gymnastica TaxID=73025 RepID=A0A7S4CVJ3_9EUGL